MLNIVNVVNVHLVKIKTQQNAYYRSPAAKDHWNSLVVELNQIDLTQCFMGQDTTEKPWGIFEKINRETFVEFTYGLNDSKESGT